MAALTACPTMVGNQNLATVDGSGINNSPWGGPFAKIWGATYTYAIDTWRINSFNSVNTVSQTTNTDLEKCQKACAQSLTITQIQLPTHISYINRMRDNIQPQYSCPSYISHVTQGHQCGFVKQSPDIVVNRCRCGINICNGTPP